MASVEPTASFNIVEPGVAGARSLKPFLVFLSLFYALWLGFIVMTDSWAIVLEGWPMALAMALGSVVAGSTPMGGGTVGFPVLVLGFDFPSQLGRDFSFAIQSVGMVSASVFILSRRLPLEWPMLRSALLGSLLGTPIGLILLAPVASGTIVKVTFGVLWASFGVLHLARLKSLTAIGARRATAKKFDRKAGFLLGFLGGVFVTALTGVGVDMMIYIVLLLICRTDLKVAIPTSVLLMAFSSVIGLTTQAILGRLDEGIAAHWLAAAPVVAIGAPLGSLAANKLGRGTILVFVSVLCILQFAWTMHHEAESLGAIGMILSLCAVLAMIGVFAWLDRLGRLRAHRRAASATGCPAE